MRDICFVISAPRSGSTWLQRALNVHPYIHCTENRFFGDYYDVVPTADGGTDLRITMDKYAEQASKHAGNAALGLTRIELRDRMLAALSGAQLEFLRSLSGKPVIVDKITPYLDTSETVLAQIERYFPGSAIIELRRDGRDVITSGVFDWIARIKRDHPRFAVFVERKPGARLERFFDDDDIEQWAREWAQPIEALARLDPAPLLISYERMKQDQAAVLTDIFNYLGLDSSAEIVSACVRGSTFEKMSGGRRAGEAHNTAKVRKGMTGDWKNYFTRRDGELFHQIAGDVLIICGYERDAGWVERLPDTLDISV